MCYKLGQACVTNWGSFILSKIKANVDTNWGSFIIANRDYKCCYKLGQRAVLTNGGKNYYKLGQVLQIRAIIIKSWHNRYN